MHPAPTDKPESSLNNQVCSDCLKTTEMLALEIDLDDDYTDKDNSPRSTAANDADNSITQHDALTACSTYDLSQSNYTEQKHETVYDFSGVGPVASRIVSPESSKNVQSINSSTKLCCTCNIRATPKQYMEYCNICYALNSKSTILKSLDATFEMTTTAKNTSMGRCRLCTGVVSNFSHQYCLKCYTAKQKDDAKRIKRELYQKQFVKQPIQQPVQNIPYICTDCGNTIHDYCWKTKCPPCYASIQKKPKLIKPPIKRQFQGKPKYRS